MVRLNGKPYNTNPVGGIKRLNKERSTERIVKAIVDPDRDPLVPPALRGGETSCSAPRKFRDLIHATNAQAF